MQDPVALARAAVDGRRVLSRWLRHAGPALPATATHGGLPLSRLRGVALSHDAAGAVDGLCLLTVGAGSGLGQHGVWRFGGVDVPLRWREAPPPRLQQGVAGSACTVRNQTSSPALVGTPGTLVIDERQPGRYSLLVAAHVVATAPQAASGDLIVVRTPAGAGFEGRLRRWAPTFGGSSYSWWYDAALVAVDNATAAALVKVLPLSSGRRLTDLRPGEPVRFLDADGRLRLQGHVVNPVADVWVDAARPDGGSEHFYLEDAVRVKMATRDGDSGAAVYDEGGRVVGVHCAGDSGDGYFWPFFRAADAFGVDLLLAGEFAALGPPAAPRAAAAPSAAPAAPLASAPQVLARTLWAEAGGAKGHSAGFARRAEALAALIVNRQAAASGSVQAVCRDPQTFACWTAHGASVRQLLALRDDDAAFAHALSLSHRALEGSLDDPTGGATVLNRLPASLPPGATETLRIDGLVFGRAAP